MEGEGMLSMDIDVEILVSQYCKIPGSNDGIHRDVYLQAKLVNFDGDCPIIKLATGEMMMCGLSHFLRYADSKKPVMANSPGRYELTPDDSESPQ